LVLQLQTTGVDSVPATPDGFQLTSSPFVINATDAGTGQPVQIFAPPLTLTYTASPDDLAAVGGDLSRLRLAFSNGSNWIALPCTVSGSQDLSCSLPHLSVFAPVVAPPPTAPLDTDVPNGHFFKQTNGFNGAGGDGFEVTDDAQASFWTEFQRLGGVDRVGYPVSGRFQYGGYWTQAFQKLVLQWRPELGQAVPVNVLDELNRHRADGWLDRERQVPPAADTSADDGLDWDAVVARHVGLLDAYPELRAFWDAAPDALETYGLPLATKDYGAFVAVRLQRATFQLWRAADGSDPRVVVGNAGDLAKEAGVWPIEASSARAPEPALTASPSG
jgi:hypothetical protein